MHTIRIGFGRLCSGLCHKSEYWCVRVGVERCNAIINLMKV